MCLGVHPQPPHSRQTTFPHRGLMPRPRRTLPTSSTASGLRAWRSPYVHPLPLPAPPLPWRQLIDTARTAGVRCYWSAINAQSGLDGAFELAGWTSLPPADSRCSPDVDLFNPFFLESRGFYDLPPRQVAINWQSIGNQLAIRWHLTYNQAAVK